MSTGRATHMADSTTPRRLSRRTVAKGAAWAVPAVAVAVPAAAAAASGEVPDPEITFGNACGNVGAAFKGCGGSKTIQVPLTLTNLSAVDVVFQITGMYTCNNCGAPPLGPGRSTSTPGCVASGRPPPTCPSPTTTTALRSRRPTARAVPLTERSLFLLAPTPKPTGSSPYP